MLRAILHARFRIGGSALLLCAFCPHATHAQDVRVGVFSLFHPREICVSSTHEARILVEPSKTMVVVHPDGGPCSARFILHKDEIRLMSQNKSFAGESFTTEGPISGFYLSIPDKIRRRFRGRLLLTSERHALVPIVVMDVEIAVASVVAAELPADAPMEAMKAQAVAARSFLLASDNRGHRLFDVCDTTHCQFLRAPPAPHSGAASAATATSGLVLQWRERTIRALYSAHCGGRTRPLSEIGATTGGYPYFSVVCDYCRRHPETTKTGYGDGHGVGLCQAGAIGMAREGSDFRAILRYYYPGATLSASVRPE